jgi:hypothetical protein
MLDILIRDDMDSFDDIAIHRLLREWGCDSGQLVALKIDPNHTLAKASSFADRCCTKIRKELMQKLLDIARPWGDGSGSDDDKLKKAKREMAEEFVKAVNEVLDFMIDQDDSAGQEGWEVSSHFRILMMLSLTHSAGTGERVDRPC